MKSEKQKMLSGELYQAFGEELSVERQHARRLFLRFNNLPPEEEKEREKILRELLGQAGQQFTIEAPFRCDYGYNIHLGERFYANYNLTILDCAPVRFGDHVFIAPNVSIYTATHPIDHELRDQDFEYALPVTIGNHVWLGGNVVINPGVTIGDNVVIGSGSVVTRDIESNVVAAGNPCRPIRQITEKDKGNI